MRTGKAAWLCCLCLLWTGIGSASAGEWYLRAGIGGEWAPRADFSDDDATAKQPPALFGTTAGNDGRPIGSRGEFGPFLSLEVAAGRRILPWLRADIAIAWRPHVVYSGTANFAGVGGEQPVSASADSISLFANAFVDLDRLLGFSLGPLRPFVGAGIGASRNHVGEMTYRFPSLVRHRWSVTPAGSDTDVAYMVTAGTGLVLTERIVFDIAYRFTDLGTLRTDPGRLIMNHMPAGIDIAGTWARLQVHGIETGIRFLF